MNEPTKVKERPKTQADPVVDRKKARRGPVSCWIGLLVILVCVSVIRVRLMDVPLERDEGEYAYAGQLMLQGIPPYELVYTVKLPGTHAAYALIMAVFGESVPGIRIGVLLISLASIVLMFLLARRLMGGMGGWSAVAAAATLAVLSTSSSTLGLAGHATHFVVLFALAGLVMLPHNRDTVHPWRTIASGLLLGLAVLMKQPGVMFVIFAAGVLLVRVVRAERVGRQPRFITLVAFCVASLAPLVLTMMLMSVGGVFDKFWFWTVTYAREYGGIISPGVGWLNLRAGVMATCTSAWPVWILAGIGVLFAAVNRRDRKNALFILGLLLCAAAATSFGLYFRRHYFLLAAPAVALLVGTALEGIAGVFQRNNGSSRVSRVVPAGLVVAALLVSVWNDRNVLFSLSPHDAGRAMFGHSPFPETAEIARYIQEHSESEDRIAVLGSEPQIYFLAHRKSLTGHIYMYGMMEPHPFAASMQEEFIQQIESGQPTFIVLARVASSWHNREDAPNLVFDWMPLYLRDHYQVDGVVDVLPDKPTVYRWGDDAANYRPLSSVHLWVFRRQGKER